MAEAGGGGLVFAAFTATGGTAYNAAVPGVPEIALFAVTVALTFLGATIAFDLVHVALHAAYRSSQPWWRAVGALHQVHHEFLDRNLQIRPKRMRANLFHHVIPEYLTQVTATLLLGAVLPLAPVLGAVAIETVVFLLILRTRGIDINHRAYERLPAYRPQGFFCVPHYHALHHVFPDAYYGSWLKAVDQIFGTAALLRDRRVLVTGAGRPLAAALAAELSRCGAEVTVVARPGEGAPAHDIVVLHHADPGDEDQYVGLVERLLHARDGARKIPLEIWSIVPEPDGDPQFVRRSRGYYFDARVSWRHIAVDRRAMGSEASEAARRIALWVRRGCHYVPALPLARAIAGFFRFRFQVEPVFVGPPARVLP